jgi:hypothetical protein
VRHRLLDGGQPPRQPLAPTPTAPAAACSFVREVCEYWASALPDPIVSERAVLLADELVTSAVVHAPTEIRLRLVERLVRAWGVNRHPGGGKVVWCVLSL